MNTLSRRTTGTILGSADTFHAIRAHWRSLKHRTHTAIAPHHSPAHHLLYLALLGKDWRKAFGPIRSKNKLENGGLHAWGLFDALNEIHSPYSAPELLAPFEGLVTPEMLVKICALLPKPNPYAYTGEMFHSLETFPFPAYDDAAVGRLDAYSIVTVPAGVLPQVAVAA